MPMQSGKSPLGRSLKAHAMDETVVRPEIAELPGGISGGVAQLVEAKLGKYSKGNQQDEQFIYLAATVLKPKSAVKTVKKYVPPKKRGDKATFEIVSSTEVDTLGQRTSIMLPLCAQQKAEFKNGKPTGEKKMLSVDESVALALNELRSIGGDECTAPLQEAPEGREEATLVEVLNSLKAAAPYIKFSTFSPDPTPEYPLTGRAFERWHGATEYVAEDVTRNGTVDSTGGADNGQSGDAFNEFDQSGEDAAGGSAQETDQTPTAESDNVEELLNIVNTSEDADEKAAAENRLIELAVAAGFDRDDAVNAESWDAVVEMIQQGQAPSEEEPVVDETPEEESAEVEEEPEPEPAPPPKKAPAKTAPAKTATPAKAAAPVKAREKVGAVCSYKPWIPNPKNPKLKIRSGKPAQVEITSINAAKKTVALKNLDNQKVVYKDVPFADLEWSKK